MLLYSRAFLPVQFVKKYDRILCLDRVIESQSPQCHNSARKDTALMAVEGSSAKDRIVADLVMQKVLFVETGFGCDQHGQNSTKAAVRACRNAIEFNSLPAMRDLVPGGRDKMVLKIKVAVPAPETVDVAEIVEVFPYGIFTPIEIVAGGMAASSGIALPELGDKNDDMIIAVAAITIGY